MADEINLLGSRPVRHFQTSSKSIGEILYVHGWWGGSWVFDLFAPRLAANGYRGSAIDLSGAGGEFDAQLDVGRISFDEHLAEILAALDDLDDPILVGHSVGALLALKAATIRPLRAVVALTPAAPRGVMAILNRKIMRMAITQMPAMVGRKAFLPSKEVIAEIDLNRLSPEDQCDVYDRMVPASGTQGLVAGTLGYPIDWKGLMCPALIVSASDDQLTPPRIARTMADRFQSSERGDLVEYPGRAHYLLREPGWEEVADDTAAWLGEHARSNTRDPLRG